MSDTLDGIKKQGRRVLIILHTTHILYIMFGGDAWGLAVQLVLTLVIGMGSGTKE
jgi:hypothetical protein